MQPKEEQYRSGRKRGQRSHGTERAQAGRGKQVHLPRNLLSAGENGSGPTPLVKAYDPHELDPDLYPCPECKDLYEIWDMHYEWEDQAVCRYCWQRREAERSTESTMEEGRDAAIDSE